MSFKQNGDHGSFSSPTTRKYEAKEQLITIDGLDNIESRDDMKKV